MNQEIVQKVNQDEKPSRRGKRIKQDGQGPEEINTDRLKGSLRTKPLIVLILSFMHFLASIISVQLKCHWGWNF